MTDLLTARAAGELVCSEGMVLEWYKDSEGIGTWGIGVTNASGHLVDRYKDKPQTVERVLEIFVWLLRTKYAPAVIKAFGPHTLTEQEFAAALSFHYNTGRIGTTDWVAMVKRGERQAAREFLETHYTNSGDLKARREGEAELFFDGIWNAKNGIATIYPVRKPSYSPWWAKAYTRDVRADLSTALSA